MNWPNTLVDDIARRRCVLVVGSGVSRQSSNLAGVRPKTWLEFLESASNPITPNKHIKQCLKREDFLTACDLVKRALGTAQFATLLRSEFLDPQFRYAHIHEVIFKLDSRLVITPNFDKIYEAYANHMSGASLIVKHHFDPDIGEAVRNSGRVVIKIHGSIDSPNRLIFTRSDYAMARSQFATFYQILEALALTHTFLFIGCGVSDPDIKLLLEDTFFRHPTSPPHTMLYPSGSLHDKVIEVIEGTMNLRFLKYSPAANHVELVNGLERLANLVDQRRIEIQTSLNW